MSDRQTRANLWRGAKMLRDALTPHDQWRRDARAWARRDRIELNAAAIRAGYSPKTAGSIAWENLKKTEIALAIATAREARSVRTGLTQDRVVAEVALLAFSDVTHYRISDGGDVTLAAGAPAGAMRALQWIRRRIILGRPKNEKPCS